MIRIVFYAPYPEIFSDIRRTFDDRPDRDEFEYEIRQDYANNPLKDLHADIIIARGFTARALKKSGALCTELQVSGYDIMAAIYKCRKLVPECCNIAMIGPFNMIYGSEAVNDILQDIHVTPYIIEDETYMDETLLRAVQEGNTAIVGTHSVLLAAQKHSIPAVMIESGPEAISSAISYAKEAVLMRKQEQERSARIENIMNFSFQGIISTDRDGKITMANSYVYSLLKIDRSLLGKPLMDLFPSIPVDAVIQNGAKILSELYRYRTMTLLVNCVPISPEASLAGCVLTFQNITQIRRQEDAIRKKLYRRETRAKYHFQDFLHQSGKIDQLLRDAQEYSYADSPVVITGETGTGKEILAQSIHNASRRKTRFFVALNCAALSETALERELFGYVEGQMRGAPGEKAGAFELAHQGTIFLDEISALSPRLQAKMLRVLQDHEVSRLGSSDVINVNVRIIAASGKNLKTEIDAGRFRKDLFYRINVLELRIPPLRERVEDIPYLIRHHLAFEKERHGGRTELISEPAMERLMRYRWPGNVRELENFCERLSILCAAEVADLADVCRVLPELANEQAEKGAAPLPGPASMSPDKGRAERGERAAARTGEEAGAGEEQEIGWQDEETKLLRLLDRFDGNRKKTAQYLGINPSTLWRRMKKMGLC